MGEPLSVRRKRLAYRSLYRGVRESDILFRRFLDNHMDDLDAADLDRFEAILAESDQDILSWISGRVPVPQRHDHSVFRRLAEVTSSTP